MATVIKKSGFWIFEKRTHYLICDRCSCELVGDDIFQDRENPNSSTKRYCKQCATEMGINLEPHDWPCDEEIMDSKGPERLYHGFTDTRDGRDKYIKSCYCCNGLMLATISGEKIDKIYYVVGEKSPRSIKPSCNRFAKEFIGGHLKNQLECHHNFLELATSRVMEQHERDFGQETFSRHKRVKLIETTTSGRRYIWCFKCGLFYGLKSHWESELKSIGINLDWYASSDS